MEWIIGAALLVLALVLGIALPFGRHVRKDRREAAELAARAGAKPMSAAPTPFPPRADPHAPVGERPGRAESPPDRIPGP